MSAFAFSTVPVCIFLLFVLKPLDGVHTQEKRSDGLLHSLLNLMVDEREERNKLRQEVAAVTDKLEDVMRELKARNSLLRDIKVQRKKLIKEVKDTKSQITSAIKAEMNTKFENISRSIKEFRKQVSKKQAEDMKDVRKVQKDESKKIRNDVKTVKDGYRQLLSNTSLVIKDLKDQIANTEVKVAFTVRLGSSSQFATNAVMKFSHVISNIGGGYNTSDGIFYCPVDGVYVFDISLTANSYVYVDAYLVKNGKKIDRVWSQTTYKHYQTATASFTLALKVGDKVWLMCPGKNRKYYQHSFFTGYLI